MLILDREGRVREPVSPISDNPAINDYARQYFATLRFKPPIQSGLPAQEVRRIAIPFLLQPSAGTETLGSAREVLERGRSASTLSAAASAPYQLSAIVSMALPSGVAQGTYTDTFLDAHHWRREATLAGSRVVRSLDGDQQYLLLDGPQARAARLVLQIVEPIPAIDTFTESDWQLSRQTLASSPTLRVLRGPLDPDGRPGANATAFWFTPENHLAQAHQLGFDFIYLQQTPFQGVSVPHLIEGRAPIGGLSLRIAVDQLAPLDPNTLHKDTFRLKGHEWKRQFTAEVR